MKLHSIYFGAVCLMLLASHTLATVFYVNVSNTAPASPFTTWETAATNIQDAIDVSIDGDLILVTNGIYQAGGKVMVGDLTNRITLNKAITVQSVNGPWVTVIQGVGATNGTAAVRCAWLTNGASLIGFTLQKGATRSTGNANTLESGGGIWCASSNAIVSNCIIRSNSAVAFGSGVYQGTLRNCFLTGNSSMISVGATRDAVMTSCTVVNNSGGGVYGGLLTNCIVYFNTSSDHPAGGTFTYCCTTPSISGVGNITESPQLFDDGVHLTITSPCIGAGTNLITGTDIFGQAWANPPSIGCAEWQPSPTITTRPQIQFTGDPIGFKIVNVAIVGQSPFAYSWLKDGAPLQDDEHFSSTQTTNLIATGVSPADAGNYQLVVSNTFGVVTSAVVQLTIHMVDIAGSNPIVPYSSWETAATNIQDAIAAAIAGDIVFVTNGLYATGGKAMDGASTNRISIDKAILVHSMNGPSVTVIQGSWDSTSTNGSSAVRCAWLTNNAVLSGFLLCGGATQNTLASGGGVWGTSNNAVIYNCVLATNYAIYAGGGAFSVTLNNCTLIGNHAGGSGQAGSGVAGAGSGGGAANCNLKNCLITSNFADQQNGGGAQNCNLTNCVLTKNGASLYGSGAYQGRLVNCTVTGNRNTSTLYSSYSGGVAYATLVNCIVYGNFNAGSGPTNYNVSCTFSYSDTSPLPSGTGNIDVDPQLLPDGSHLAATSPCIGAGISNVISGTDIDGQPWNNPPAIGCDEWQPAPVIAAQPVYQVNPSAHRLTFNIIIAGLSPFDCFWTKDGVSLQNDIHHSNSGATNLVVNNFGPEDSGIYQVVVSNAFGYVTSQVAQVVIHAVNIANPNPMPPYSTWATAATNIQEAINVASAGDIVLVTNGTFAAGGKVMDGDLTNRVALDKAVIVTSVNGFNKTVIEGAWDAVSTNGSGAVRCAYLADGAILSGFTLQNGATRNNGNTATLQSGGGAWCVSDKGIVANCVLSNNSAIYGGGISYGTLNNCLVTFNLAVTGGGAYDANLTNCTVVNNYTTTSTPSRGAGTFGGITVNSIVMYNFDNYPVGLILDNTYSILAQYSYCCTSPGISGTSNITLNPQFLDLFHISSTSPCVGTGNALYASGTDLDGEAWNNPPSMGCDEVIVSNIVGPLSVTFQALQTNWVTIKSDSFWGTIVGRASRVEWSFGDGSTVKNSGVNTSHSWTNSGDYFVTLTAYNSDNPSGVSTNLVVHVDPFPSPQLQAAMWATNGFQFQFSGVTNQYYSVKYTVQYATNLVSPVSWQTLQIIGYVYTGNSVIQVNDSQTNLTRFYRVLAE